MCDKSIAINYLSLVGERDGPSNLQSLEYGVRFCGLPALNEENEVPPPNKEIGVPSPSAKQRHFGAELSVESKGKEKVSTFALTMLI